MILDALRKCPRNIWSLKTKDHTESKSAEAFYTLWLKDFKGTQRHHWRQSWAVRQGEGLLTVHYAVGTRWCSSFPFPRQHSSILTSFIQHLTRALLCHGCISAILTLPQGRNALTVTKMYLKIMENPFARWRVMHSKQRSYSGGPKLISPRAARKMNSQQQQYFTIIYMKTPQNNGTGGYFKNRWDFFFSYH